VGILWLLVQLPYPVLRFLAPACGLIIRFMVGYGKR
ncbi:DUF2545 family protein, partial [Salmonella enterica subsp. enterica serovar Typhimurium]